jgi:hypothetical protein
LSAEVRRVAHGEAMPDPDPDRRLHGEAWEVRGCDPRGLAGLVQVTVGNTAQGASRNSTANCWRTSPPGERTTWPGSVNSPANSVTTTCTPASSAVPRTAASTAVSPTSTRPPGNSQAPLSHRRIRSRRPPSHLAATKTDGTTTAAVGAEGSWKNTCRITPGRSIVVMTLPARESGCWPRRSPGPGSAPSSAG